jgi:hypothetical protein
MYSLSPTPAPERRVEEANPAPEAVAEIPSPIAVDEAEAEFMVEVEAKASQDSQDLVLKLRELKKRYRSPSPKLTLVDLLAKIQNGQESFVRSTWSNETAQKFRRLYPECKADLRKQPERAKYLATISPSPGVPNLQLQFSRKWDEIMRGLSQVNERQSESSRSSRSSKMPEVSPGTPKATPPRAPTTPFGPSSRKTQTPRTPFYEKAWGKTGTPAERAPLPRTPRNSPPETPSPPKPWGEVFEEYDEFMRKILESWWQALPPDSELTTIEWPRADWPFCVFEVEKESYPCRLASAKDITWLPDALIPKKGPAWVFCDETLHRYTLAKAGFEAVDSFARELEGLTPPKAEDLKKFLDSFMQDGKQMYRELSHRLSHI